MIADIQRAVAAEHGVPLSVMRERDGFGSRNRERCWPRQEAIYLSLMLTEQSQPRIGDLFGHRDHTTIIAARHSVQRRLAVDDALKARMRRVTLALVRG